jgi:hypothetical protein
MSIFKRKETAMPETTGIDVLRSATKARRRAGNFGGLARDLRVSIADLEAFADNGKPLAEPVMQALAKEMFGAKLNADGLLEPLNKAEVKPMCASGYPPRLDPKTSPFYVPPRVPGEFYPPPQSVKPEKPKVKTSRPGWLGGWT